MLRFIFFCMAFILVSFAAMPIYFGIAETHDQLTQTAQVEVDDSKSLTFQEIYALADESLLTDPSFLNAIAPAAGEDMIEEFSNGFSGTEDSALAEDTLSF